jgi:solute carrier family 25 phosphate transporter 23/24/25/41
MLLQANAISIEQPSVSSLSSQAQRVLATSGAAAASSASASSLPVRSRQSVVIEGLRQIYREAGVRGYFRGNGTNAVKGSSELSIRFFTYERLKSWFSDRADGVLSTKERFMAGAGAGLISQIAIYPLEVLKTRLGVESQHKSVIGCIRHVVQQGGIAGLYRGLPASCVGIVPYCGIDLTAYALLKDAYAKRFSTDAPVAAMLGFGIVSSSCAQAVVYPLAVAKTRLQLQTHKIGMVRCVTQIVRQEGVRGLYKGLFVNILKVAPAAGISYVVYDTLRVLLDA